MADTARHLAETYVDTGCSLHFSCLSCPLSRCRYDVRGGERAMLRESRNQFILEVAGSARLTRDHAKGIAERLGLNWRTVYRVLEKARHEP